MMKNRAILFAILICLITTSAGCWDQVELDKRAIIVAIGVDKAEKAGEITLTLQSIIPSRLSTPMRSGEARSTGFRQIS
jgi:spore germination protein KC